jgi:hypothetical protein
VPGRSPFSHAVYRLVPDLERGERLNVGVIVFCRPRQFLGLRTHLQEERALALAPALDVDAVRAQLRALERVAAGDDEGGPIARLDPTARFHWLTAPASTIVQPSQVHTGVSDDPGRTLAELFRTLVLPPAGPAQARPGSGRA